jgi:hypothetical protein
MLFAEARVLLYRDLIAAFRSDPYSNNSYGLIATMFENAFIEYATAILLAAAPDIDADDATACLAKLRGEVIDSIVAWIEPGVASADNTSADPFLNMSPNGEWEQRLTEAHQLFCPRHPRILFSPDAETLLFLFNFVFRLRHHQHRSSFRASLESVLLGAIIELEPQVLKRFAERIQLEQIQLERIQVMQIEVAPPIQAAPIQAPQTRPHRRGFPAASDAHLRVLAKIEPYGKDWSTHLPEICRSLDGEVIVPASWRQKAGRTWDAVAEELELGTGELRGLVSKYIRYRISWLQEAGGESSG